MARSRYYHDPSLKHLEVYQNFGLGLNTESSTDNLADNELVELTNFDIRARGALRRAKGYKLVYNLNLVPSFNDDRWQLHVNTVVDSSHKLTLNATNTLQGSHIELDVEPNQPYTFSSTFKGIVIIYEVRENGQLGDNVVYLDQQDELKETITTFEAPTNKIRISLTNVKANTTYTFENIMLVEGTEHSKFSQMVEGKAQGYFRFYKSPTEFDEIVVIGGKFYVNGVETPVGDGKADIQTDRPMEAVQYYDKLYIASGSGLMEYDGETLNFVTPYQPKSLESLYIGTNGLLPNPNDYMETTSGHAVLKIKGVTFSSRYVSQNEPVTIKAYAEKVNEDDELEWLFERRLPSHKEGYYFKGRDWDTDNTYSFTTYWTGTMEIKVSVRKKGSEVAVDEFIIPHFTIKPTDDPEDEEISSASIDNCNRILVHWDRLILYGDYAQPDVIYISHLKNPAYFPVTNSQRFLTTNKEGITKIVRFRDNLIVFTPTTTQAFYGKAPIGDDPYFRVMLNSSIGCIAPETAKVTGNYITFLSYEGVYRLKSLGYTENKANVEPVDLQIRSEIPKHEDASAYVYDNHYCITFPQEKKQYRLMYDYGVWTSLEHEKLDYEITYFYDGNVYLQGKNGRVVQADVTDVQIEGTVTPAIIQTKNFDFLEPYAKKKVKELHLLLETNKPTKVKVFVYIDDKLSIRNQHEIDIVPEQDTYQVALAGRGHTASVRLVHEDDAHLQVNGLGVIFKLKRP